MKKEESVQGYQREGNGSGGAHLSPVNRCRPGAISPECEKEKEKRERVEERKWNTLMRGEKKNPREY